jgi:chromosome transmission fidelity protein 8
MSTVQLHPKSLLFSDKVQNPLPQLLHTPSGLALLEIQGTINLPSHDELDSIETGAGSTFETSYTPIGRLIFPDYDEADKDSKAWMKKVYMYVGKHQRLTGEVKKLPKAIAIIRKRTVGLDQGDRNQDVDMDNEEDTRDPDQLEVVEIVKYKIIFSTRPEPVGTWAVGDGI